MCWVWRVTDGSRRGLRRRSRQWPDGLRRWAVRSTSLSKRCTAHARVGRACGEMENRIKEAQLELSADRTSSHAFRSNQMRLWFSSFAYTLIEALRRLGLQQTQFAQAGTHRIWLCLLKIGAVITLSVRRMKMALSSAHA